MTEEQHPKRVADYGLSDHKELLDRARRTETKLTTLISALGMEVRNDGSSKCEVSVQNGITTINVEAADTPLSSIKASLIKAGFDPLKCSDVRIIIGGTTFGYINFT